MVDFNMAILDYREGNPKCTNKNTAVGKLQSESDWLQVEPPHKIHQTNLPEESLQ